MAATAASAAAAGSLWTQAVMRERRQVLSMSRQSRRSRPVLGLVLWDEGGRGGIIIVHGTSHVRDAR